MQEYVFSNKQLLSKRFPPWYFVQIPIMFFSDVSLTSLHLKGTPSKIHWRPQRFVYFLFPVLLELYHAVKTVRASHHAAH